MRTLIAVAALALGAAALTAQDDKKYEADGKFRANFPAATTTIKREAGGLKLNIVLAEPEKGKGGMMVVYSDIPADKLKAPTPDQVLESCERALKEDFMLKNVTGTTLKDAKPPTRTVTGDRDDLTINGRIVLSGTRLYQVYAFGPKEFATGADATKFIESFAVIEDKKPDDKK
jgi:hypothetical protein